MDENLLFSNEISSNDYAEDNNCWKVIIADDDDEIHKVTKIVLGKEQFEGKKLKFISTYSGEETKDILAKHLDAAVIFLDVVMESDQSGLEVAKYIREELKNNKIRIILRTGQPGYAPESVVIRNYDINDYKEKTELTSKKMLTSILSALRSYRDIDAIEKNRIGLEKIIDSTSSLLVNSSTVVFIKMFIREFNNVISSVINTKDNNYSIFVAKKTNSSYSIVAGNGKYENFDSKSVETVFDSSVIDKIYASEKIKKGYFEKNIYRESIKTSRGDKYFLYVEKFDDFTEVEKYIIKVYFHIVTVSFDNIELIEFQKRIFHELKLERERAELASNAKDEFMSNMSHELRTPMAGITGILQLLSPEKIQGKYLDILNHSSERLMRLIENMLSFSEMAQKSVTIVESEFKVETILNTVTSLLYDDSAKKGLQIICHIDPKVDYTLIGDVLKIEQILFNLIENSIKFTENGEINISIEEVSTANSESTIRFIVEDTGIGIDESKIDDVFEPFVQGEYYLTKKYAGIGLGLTICKKLTELMKGTIKLESTLNKGSKFIVDVPLRKK